MRTVYKYKLNRGTFDVSEVQIPSDAKIVLFDVQNHGLYIWAEVETDNPTVTRRFRVMGTGWELSELPVYTLRHRASIQKDSFVWHLYELVL